MPRLPVVLWEGPLDIQALAAKLDALDAAERVAAVRGIGGAQAQRAIWQAAEGRATTLEDLVPAGTPPGTAVIHAGKSSLPLFTQFEKRFTRAEGGEVLYGYNEGSTRWLIGPGYFVARRDPERSEVAIDYYRVPPADARLPAGWPQVKPNERGLQRFVFAEMIDYLRRVSQHVTIGRAVKRGVATENYFLLCQTRA
jgi:hypothetical protein